MIFLCSKSYRDGQFMTLLIHAFEDLFGIPFLMADPLGILQVASWTNKRTNCKLKIVTENLIFITGYFCQT